MLRRAICRSVSSHCSSRSLGQLASAVRQPDGSYRPVQISPQQQQVAQAPAQQVPQSLPAPPAPQQGEEPKEPAWQPTKGTEGTGITATPIKVPPVSEEALSAFPKA